jgi:hypothetical protein
MTTYRLESRASAFIVLIIIIPFFLFFVFVAAVLVTSRSSATPIGIVFVIVLPWVAWALIRRVVAIRVRNDGVVEFRRIIGTTTISSREIRSLHGEWVDDTYNHTKVWQISIRHAEGTLTLPEFEGVMTFVDQVRDYHPSVEISGIWPLGLAPGIRPNPGDPERARRR